MSIPVFTKSELLKDCVFDLDDFYFKWDRNALSELFYLKTLYPKLKVTLFTVPNHPDCPFNAMRGFLRLVSRHKDWIQLACHGWFHHTPTEAKNWTKKQTNFVLDQWVALGDEPFIQRGFKAPGWQISDETYKALLERNFWVADHIYNEDRRPKGLKAYTLAHPWCFHGHTWDLPNKDPKYRNGIRQLFLEHKLPWDKNTRFWFVSEVVE